jgi:hypothetical protein
MDKTQFITAHATKKKKNSAIGIQTKVLTLDDDAQ